MSTEKRDPMDGDYVGNLFGWRISIIGAIVIGALILLAAGRHYYLGVPFGYEDPDAPPPTEVPADSVATEKTE